MAAGRLAAVSYTRRRMETLLAFDSSTERLHFAVARGEHAWVRDADGGARASATLIAAITTLLADAGVALADLDAIAFGRGPGAFTGLRTACAVAQGLAWGAGKPVLALDTLLAVAEDARAGAARWDGWVAVDARMDEVYAARYGFEAGGWQVLEAPRLMAPEVLAAAWRDAAPRAVAGNAVAVFGERLGAGAATQHAQAAPRGAALLALARCAWRAGQGVDAALALPLYLRDKVALTTAERDAARQASAEGAMP